MEEWILYQIAAPGQRPYLSLFTALSQHPAQYFALTRLSINIQLADGQPARGSFCVPLLSLPHFMLIHTVPENTNNIFYM